MRQYFKALLKQKQAQRQLEWAKELEITMAKLIILKEKLDLSFKEDKE